MAGDLGTLSSSSITVNVGESGQITFNGYLYGVESADTSIATVKADGNYSGTITITGISAGNTTATVHWTGGSSSITITVINNEDTSFLNKRGLTYFWSKINSKLSTKANSTDLAPVATSGSYSDLINKPTISTVDTALSSTSTNPVQNKVIYEAIGDIESVLQKLNNGSGAA